MGSHQSPVPVNTFRFSSQVFYKITASYITTPITFFFQHKMLVSPSSLCLLMTLCMFCTMPATIQGWPKRRYGSKYDDNKSYGFWISALNKAGNYKRGKRSSHPDYSDMVELVPDNPLDKEVQQ